MQFVILRHGQTQGNGLGRLVGTHDEPLSEVGLKQAHAFGSCPQIELVYTTPRLRAQQTAALCFPNAEKRIIDDLREMSFGAFEGRDRDELQHDEAFRAWMDSCCTTRCPGGEARDEFTARIAKALQEVLVQERGRGAELVVVVAHGGTIMSTMSSFAEEKRAYQDWLVKNCTGYCCDVSFTGVNPRLTNRRLISHGDEIPKF